jgi:hypothetical protein
MTARALRAWLLAACMLLAVPLHAQDYAHAWDPRTGDDWTDGQLADVNAYGQRYPDAFVDELVRYFGAPRALVTELVVDRRWAPGDVYYACAIARVVGRPCRALTDAWARRHAEGWEAVRADAGIAAEGAEAGRLRQAFIESYARWDRPIDADGDGTPESLRAEE